MSREIFYLTYEWGPRPEGLASCAKRLGETLSRLGRIDPGLTSWNNLGRKKIYQVPIENDILKKWLLSGVRYTDIDPQPMLDIGYFFTLIAEDDNVHAKLEINCGASHEDIGNTLYFDIYQQEIRARDLMGREAYEEISKVIISSWEPDWGRVTSMSCLDRMTDPALKRRAGWMTYLSDAYKDVVVPPPGRVEPVKGGRLVIATDELFSSENPEHIGFVKKLAQLMLDDQKKRGVLDT